LEEIEKFKRINVIQPTVLPHRIPSLYHDLPTLPLSMAYHFQPQNTGSQGVGAMAISTSTQEQPVDFSPKNNFTHSAKTSPFELTGNYAMVA